MKIFYITQFFYPEMAAAANRAFDNATFWQKMGHEVTVFTGYPNFPTGKLFGGWEMKMLQEEYIKNIKVLRSKIIIRPNSSKCSRFLLYMSFPFFASINMLINREKFSHKYDIVLATSGTIFAPIIGYFFAKLRRIPFAVELRDITFDQILANNGGVKNIEYLLVKGLELFYCRQADKIITVTEGFKNRLVQVGIDSTKIDVIYNGVVIDDDNDIGKNNERNHLLKNFLLKNENEILITYFGTFGISQDLSRIIEIVDGLIVPGKAIKLLMIGDGAEKEKLKAYIKENNLGKKAYILDSVPKDALKKYYEISDFCLVTLKNNSHFKNTVPSKIFNIMANKKPIIYIGPDGECASIIEKAKAGIIIKAIEKDDIIAKLNDFLILFNKNDILNGYEYVKQNHDREKLAIKYAKVLSEVKGECIKKE